MNDFHDRLHVRDATPDDLNAIVEYNRLLAWESEGKQLDPTVLSQGVRAVFERPGLARYFMAELQAEPSARVIGQTMITYEWTDWRNGVFWWIQSVFVEADFRGRGVFRALFSHIERLAKATPEVRGLRLYVDQHNAVALATYRRLGLEPTGHLMYEVDWSGAVRKG